MDVSLFEANPYALVPIVRNAGTICLDKEYANLQYGDLIICIGTTPDSVLVQNFTFTKFTHIGIILRSKRQALKTHPRTFIQAKKEDLIDEDLFIFHSTITRHTLVDGTVVDVSGPHIEDLYSFLKTYRGTCYLRRLLYRPTFVDFDKNEDLWKWILIQLTKPYTTDKAELYRAAKDGELNLHNRSTLTLNKAPKTPDGMGEGAFCSELVAAMLHQMKILTLPKEDDENALWPAKEWIPADFAKSMLPIPLNSPYRFSGFLYTLIHKCPTYKQ